MTIDKIEPLIYEPIRYIKVREGNRGWSLDLLEIAFLGNAIEEVYQTKGISLHSKTSTQNPLYLRAIDKHLTKNNIYVCIFEANEIKKKVQTLKRRQLT